VRRSAYPRSLARTRAETSGRFLLVVRSADRGDALSRAETGSTKQTAPAAASCDGGPAQIDLADRLRAIEAAIAVLWPLTEKSKPALDEIRLDLGRVRDALENGTPGSGPSAPPLESVTAAAEQSILEIDARVATGAYGKMPVSHLQPEQIARFAGLLARHANQSPSRIDRVELLVARLCLGERQEERGQHPPAEVVSLLRRSGCVPGDPDSRTRALAFFDAAAQRLVTLATVDDIFDSGLYLDMRGYKISLKEERLDPDVLYAAASFTLRMDKCIGALPRSAKITESSLAARFEEAERHIELLFGKDLGSFPGEERSRPFTAEDDLPRTDRVPFLRRAGVRRNLLRAVGLALAVAGAALFVVRARGSANLKPLPPAQLAKLSPLLESGSMSQGKDTFLLARIPSSRWFLMSRSERRAAASDLRNQLLRRKIGAAVVFRDDDVLAIQIEQGRVLAVE
jgi:hypothetical protein